MPLRLGPTSRGHLGRVPADVSRSPPGPPGSGLAVFDRGRRLSPSGPWFPLLSRGALKIPGLAEDGRVLQIICTLESTLSPLHSQETETQELEVPVE